jgi:hypothetical protein
MGFVLTAVLTLAVTASAQQPPHREIPITLLSDHVVREGDDVFMTTAYPMQIGKVVIAAGSYLRCTAGAQGKDKNALPLSDCQMLYQAMGEDNHTYKANLTGNGLSIRWRHRLFWDQLVNAGETWQGAVGSFAIGSTAALFTSRHDIMAVGTAAGFAVTAVGTLAKHHPQWFLHAKKSAIPADARALLFDPGQSALTSVDRACVRAGCPESPRTASGERAAPSNGPVQAPEAESALAADADSYSDFVWRR